MLIVSVYWGDPRLAVDFGGEEGPAERNVEKVSLAFQPTGSRWRAAAEVEGRGWSEPVYSVTFDSTSSREGEVGRWTFVFGLWCRRIPWRVQCAWGSGRDGATSVIGMMGWEVDCWRDGEICVEVEVDGPVVDRRWLWRFSLVGLARRLTDDTVGEEVAGVGAADATRLSTSASNRINLVYISSKHSRSRIGQVRESCSKIELWYFMDPFPWTTSERWMRTQIVSIWEKMRVRRHAIVHQQENFKEGGEGVTGTSHVIGSLVTRSSRNCETGFPEDAALIAPSASKVVMTVW